MLRGGLTTAPMPPPPASPGTPPTSRSDLAGERRLPSPVSPGTLPTLAGGETPPSPGFAGYSPDFGGGESAPLPRLRRVLPRLWRGRVWPPPPTLAVQHLGLTIGGRTMLGTAMKYTGPGVVRHRPLRVGACLSLTGRYRPFGTQAA